MRKVLYILSELADEDVDWLMRHGVRETHPADAVLIVEGRRIDVLYILLDGRLRVTLDALGGREVAVLQRGEILGELSFLDSRPPSATVTALDEVSVLSVRRDALAEKLQSDSGFAARFYRALGVFLASRLRSTQLRLGYGAADASAGVASAAAEDEIDPELLDGLALAGARFDWMLKRLRAAPGSGERP
jgi:bacteriocin-type transport-associated protein